MIILLLNNINHLFSRRIKLKYESYKKLVSVLKKKCPLAFPVSVRRIKLTEVDGDCALHKKKFYIRINNSLDEGSAIETLLHEWAHGRAWNHLHDSLDWNEFEERSHDASWGVSYSEVYRIYEKYFLDQEKNPINDRKCKFKYK